MSRAWPHKDGVVQLGGLSVETLAATYDTPTYVTDGGRVASNYRALRDALTPYGPLTVAYAVKANAGHQLLQLLHTCGASVDVVSPGESLLAHHAGFAPDQIYFTGTNPRTDELAWLVKQGVAINLDSISMAERIGPIAKHATFGVRINPGVGAGHHEHVNTGAEETKFGIHTSELPALLDVVKQHGHKITRLHAHIGSGIMEGEPYLALIDTFKRVADLCTSHGSQIAEVDLGGGFGIPYRTNETPLELAQFTKTVGAHFRKTFGDQIQLIIEPGRYLVGDSTLLLTRINTIKKTPHVTFAGVDAGFNTLLRPILYQAHHEILPITKMDRPRDHHYTVCGPICETGDVFGHQRSLPTMDEGDLVAISDVGAYGAVMASRYNSRPLPAEVLVHEGQAIIMRPRESLAELGVRP